MRIIGHINEGFFYGIEGAMGFHCNRKTEVTTDRE
jgi:hypothetical protein